MDLNNGTTAPPEDGGAGAAAPHEDGGAGAMTVNELATAATVVRFTFSRARKILGIRILPRAPTLQTYLFWPIGESVVTFKLLLSSPTRKAYYYSGEKSNS